MAAYDESNLIPFRVSELWRGRDALSAWQKIVDDDLRDLKYVKEEMAHLAAAFESLRKTLLGFAFTLAGSAVVFALTVLIATGKIGGH